jgi:asparagine synthase (glutamine-hydrolysing)
MSIIFGLLKEPGTTVVASELEEMGATTGRYATGVNSTYRMGRLGMGLQPYISHERSAMETGPSTDAHRLVLSFDGRLDNYRELAQLLELEAEALSDSQIVLAAFNRWEEECFSRLVGDWALALWSWKDKSLYLARDHAGTRSLYFRHGKSRLVWSTYLDTFQQDNGRLRLSEDYAACYLASQHIGNLTPYEGILSVPPAHYLIVRNDIAVRHTHWTPMARGVIRYNSDEEYEAHFLALFSQSVERRTGPGAPILAQLSGGMDSTAIVCMSDHLRRSVDPDSEILDTISFYDDSEASLNERTYFSVTETHRGRVGTHINSAFSQRTFEPHDVEAGIYLLPGADSFSIQQERRLRDVYLKCGYRSILSGIGGDEVLGGVPTAFPELADYLVSGNLRALLRRSIAWSLVDRIPIAGTLYNTARYAIRLYSRSRGLRNAIPPWLPESLRSRCQQIVKARGRGSLSRLGIAPHRLDNANAWTSAIETLPHLFPQVLSRPEYRYPFLDKDLVNFLFSIPREQVVRPGRRRSLMRRALVGIVPQAILERRRKAFQLRAPLATVQHARSKLERLFADSELRKAGLIDIEALRLALGEVAEGEVLWHQALLKTIAFELWMTASNPRRVDLPRPTEDSDPHKTLTVS